MLFSSPTTFLTLLLTTTLTSALPQTKRTDCSDNGDVDTSKTYYGVSINANIADSFSEPRLEPIPVQINVLAHIYAENFTASALSFDSAVAINVDLNTVECRAYKDADGVVPGSAPFTYAVPAQLSLNVVEVGSILCYIV